MQGFESDLNSSMILMNIMYPIFSTVTKIIPSIGGEKTGLKAFVFASLCQAISEGAPSVLEIKTSSLCDVKCLLEVTPTWRGHANVWMCGALFGGYNSHYNSHDIKIRGYHGDHPRLT